MGIRRNRDERLVKSEKRGKDEISLEYYGAEPLFSSSSYLYPLLRGLYTKVTEITPKN